MILVGETGHEHSIDEALEECRRRGPPGGILKHEMVAPEDGFASFGETWLRLLLAHRSAVKNRIEFKVTEENLTDDVIPRASAADVRISDRGSERILFWMSVDDQDLSHGSLPVGEWWPTAGRNRSCRWVVPCGTRNRTFISVGHGCRREDCNQS